MQISKHIFKMCAILWATLFSLFTNQKVSFKKTGFKQFHYTIQFQHHATLTFNSKSSQVSAANGYKAVTVCAPACCLCWPMLLLLRGTTTLVKLAGNIPRLCPNWPYNQSSFTRCRRKMISLAWNKMYSKTQIFVWRCKNFQHGILTDMLKLGKGRSSYLALKHWYFYSTLSSGARWNTFVCKSLRALCQTATMLVWSYIPFGPTSYTFHCVIYCQYINLYTSLNFWYFKYSAYESMVTHVQFLLHTCAHTHTHTHTHKVSAILVHSSQSHKTYNQSMEFLCTHDCVMYHTANMYVEYFIMP